MSEWQSMKKAPKGGGAERVSDPAWIDPPSVLLASEKGMAVARWDWYYAEGGVAWVIDGGELFYEEYGQPVAWMPLPVLLPEDVARLRGEE